MALPAHVLEYSAREIAKHLVRMATSSQIHGRLLSTLLHDQSLNARLVKRESSYLVAAGVWIACTSDVPAVLAYRGRYDVVLTGLRSGVQRWLNRWHSSRCAEHFEDRVQRFRPLVADDSNLPLWELGKLFAHYCERDQDMRLIPFAQGVFTMSMSYPLRALGSTDSVLDKMAEELRCSPVEGKIPRRIRELGRPRALADARQIRWSSVDGS